MRMQCVEVVDEAIAMVSDATQEEMKTKGGQIRHS